MGNSQQQGNQKAKNSQAKPEDPIKRTVVQQTSNNNKSQQELGQQSQKKNVSQNQQPQIKQPQKALPPDNKNDNNNSSKTIVKQVGTNGQIIQPARKIERKDPALYRFIDQSEKTLVKLPGEIAGEQFVVQNCKDCIIYLLDYSNTVFIDDCTDCRIYVGPVESSVFIRECINTRLIIACGQFRTRNCVDCRFLLMCQSQPIIESSIRIGFGCFRAAYPELANQMEKSKLDRWNNTWSDIFDFTKNYRTSDNHFYYLPQDTLFQDMMPPISKIYRGIDENYELDTNNQVIPFTYEKYSKKFIDEILLIFFPSFTNSHDIKKLTQCFQPAPFLEQEILIDEKAQDQDDVIIDGIDGEPYFLVKGRHSYLFPENIEPFKQAMQVLPQGDTLVQQVFKNGQMERIFGLHIRTDNEEVNLIGYLRSILAMLFDETPLKETCIVITTQPNLEVIAKIVFSNMQDEKGENNPKLS